MRAITCKICGALFGTDLPNRKYCDKCSKTAYKHCSPIKDPVDSSREKLPEGFVNCTVSIMKKCIYGGTCGGYPCCNYILVKGVKRDCPANRCDKFEEGENVKVIL